MDTELMLDVGQANELKLAFRRTGYTNAEIKKLCEGDILARLLPVVKGHAEVVVKKYIIDCDADPFVPIGLKLESHTKGGQFIFNPTEVELCLSYHQRGACIQGNKLREELADKPVLNANVLDYLLKNPHLIPESWKKDSSGDIRFIFFWGTIYLDLSGRGLCVRGLCCLDGSRWRSTYQWLVKQWSSNDPAALRVD